MPIFGQIPASPGRLPQILRRLVGRAIESVPISGRTVRRPVSSFYVLRGSVVSNGSFEATRPYESSGRPFLLCSVDWTVGPGPGGPIIVNRLDSSSGSSLDVAKSLIEVLLRLALSLFLCV